MKDIREEIIKIINKLNMGYWGGATGEKFIKIPFADCLNADEVIDKLQSLISTAQREAVEGFVNEFLEESARTDREIGMNPKDKKIQRWVDINSLREDMYEYLSQPNPSEKGEE